MKKITMSLAVTSSQTLSYFLLIFLTSLSVRWCVSIHPYSGAGKPPLFGDYEAQRHWMEVTFNLPVKEWYHNSSVNDFQYWGLDYPPLTAYHSWLCGYVANQINPQWVSLHSSRGFESDAHKLFMRYTVILIDILVYIPVVLLFCVSTLKRTVEERLFTSAVILMYPGLIIIDHGHFQYNNASLGLAVLAVTMVALRHDLWGSFFFVCALNYKQMELYHSIPFFCILLGKCLRSMQEYRLWKLIKIGSVVLLTFGLCWLPFLSDKDLALQVLHRLFPFGRGLFEDKVSNVWCVLDVLLKLKRSLAQEYLVLASLVSTLAALFPSALDLLITPSVEKFKYSLVNCSLVFFLFSYQVHEKSILIPAVSSCLVFSEQPFLVAWFLTISTFSMLPLLTKDDLLLPYAALTVMFIMMVVLYFRVFKPQPTRFILKLMGVLSGVGVVILGTLSVTVSPPARYPDIFPVLISGYSCGHFLFFLACFYYLQVVSAAERTIPGDNVKGQNKIKTSIEMNGKGQTKGNAKSSKKQKPKKKKKSQKMD